MLEYDFHSSVTYWVCHTAHLLQREMNAELAPRGITFRQAQVLGCLANEGPLSQVELAERLSIEPPSLVPVLDRMQRDGMVERSVCPEDRRRRIICPLPKAKAHWSEIVDSVMLVRTAIAEDLTPAQIEQLNSTLTVIRQGCQRRAEQRQEESQ